MGPLSADDALRFSVGEAKGKKDTVVLGAGDLYSAERGYGFSGPAPLEVVTGEHGSSVVSAEPFYFHVDLPEGNYRVKALLGGGTEKSETTIKAESRRLMVHEKAAGAGELAAVEFLVNIRTPALPDGGEVTLNSREIGVLHWDERLTLEFGGKRPMLAALTISPEPEAVTVYLAGDSTVTDQTSEPWCGWGQMLPAYFDANVSVANHAESGLSMRSFVAHRRLEKMLTTLKPGDFVLVQFGHNDQKQSGPGIGPFESYADALRDLAEQVRDRGAFPVFVTSMYRRRFDGDEMFDTLGDYPMAMRQVAKEEAIPLIDLHAGSRVIFEALGAEGSKRAFVHFPANTFPGQEEALRDDSHFTPYGANLLARFVVEGIRGNVPGLAKHVREGLKSFDPASPGSPDEWSLSLSPPLEFARPEGS